MAVTSSIWNQVNIKELYFQFKSVTQHCMFKNLKTGYPKSVFQIEQPRVCVGGWGMGWSGCGGGGDNG